MAAHLADPDHNPSFTKGIFLGELREDLVFPFPELAPGDKENLTAILDSFRAWAAGTVDSARLDREGRFGDDVRAGMADLGMMGLNIPAEYGGFGASALLFARVFGEVGTTDAALAVYFGAHQSIGCKGITLFGTEDQKRRWLTPCATGERIAAFCLTESGSGSDAQAMRTTAIPSADGSHYVLNGEKIWISNAGYAGVFTVFAKVPVEIEGKAKHRVTAFIVDARAPGVSLGKIEEKMGIKASDTRTVSFENVRVPVEDRLGEVGGGFRIALEILNSGRLGLAAGSSRGARAILDHALAYAKERKQFGRPIGSFEMIQRKFALAAADCYAADAGWMICASMVDRGGIDFSLETAACKVFASELSFRAACDAQQIAGGLGYSKEYPYEQAVRDSRIMLIFEGTNEILRALISLSAMQQPGEQLKELGKAFRDPLRSLGAIGSYMAGRVKRQLVKPDFTRVHEALKEEAEMVAGAVHDVALAVEKLLIEHGKDVIERQFHQERLANVAIDIYLSTAALSRATWAIARAGSVEGAAADLDNARIFISMAMRRTRRALRALERNQDARLKVLAERALESGTLTVATPTDA
ncbi:MAG: acyl-CoA dehydrogenase family protein [Betaproteobacteria bacterium]|nr:acyl-CoA dehydrogenase family protein [Betaproteobacteria bacterium]